MTVAEELERVVRREHTDPHHVLGAHPQDGGVVVRAYRPNAQRLRAPVAGRAPVELEQRHPAGVFEGVVAKATLPLRYRLEVSYPDGATFELDDPYSFLPTLGELDLHLAREGRHEELYEKLGAHVREVDGVLGTAFAVWAPNARSISVVGDFNNWDGRLHAMRTLGQTGIWELFVPATSGFAEGSNYKFEVRRQDGRTQLRADPYAFATGVQRRRASVVSPPHREGGAAAGPADRRSAPPYGRPLSIYEVHLGSWREGLGYRELAEHLGGYVRDLGFTHVELLP